MYFQYDIWRTLSCQIHFSAVEHLPVTKRKIWYLNYQKESRILSNRKENKLVWITNLSSEEGKKKAEQTWQEMCNLLRFTRAHTHLLRICQHQDDVSLLELELTLFRSCVALCRHPLVLNTDHRITPTSPHIHAFLWCWRNSTINCFF